MIQRRWFARLRYGAAALLFFLCFWLTPMQTEAATDGMLTIICKDGDTILPNLTWKLYRVGSYSSSGELLLEGDFADYPVNGKLTTTAEVQDAADTLANLTVVDCTAFDWKNRPERSSDVCPAGNRSIFDYWKAGCRWR